MGLLITFIKWVIGKAADNWIGVLASAFLGAVGITSVVATAWIKHLIERIMCAVAVPGYVFWPWLILTIVGVGFYLWAFLRRPPATAQKFYGCDIVEDFQWRWDVSANPSNASPYGKVFNLTRYCRKCQSVSFKIDFQGATQALVTCNNPNCRLVTPVTDLNRQEDRVKVEVERRAATNEWKGDMKRIRRAAKAK